MRFAFMFLLAASLLPVPSALASDVDYQVATEGTRHFGDPDNGYYFRMLLEASNLGSDELEMAEMVFPVGYKGGGHAHGSTEVFYVLSGSLTHIVNGEGRTLTPGQVGIVRAGDNVVHITSEDQPTKLLVLWLPGGETARVFGDQAMEPIAPLAVSPMQ